MITYIKAKLNKSHHQMNIDKYKEAANITEYNIILKLIFLRIIIQKFMKIRQLFHVQMDAKISKINMFKIDVWTLRSLYCT